ncbi:peptidyl-alpha-hydroxyglycine alpha-amidating lyase 1-like [Saccoglossus kowalevskii]
MTAVHSWPTGGIDDGVLPVTVGEIAGISSNTVGNIVIFHRGSHKWSYDSFDNNNVFTEILQGPIPENVILTLDSRTGAIMESWGADKFYLPHGITIDHEDNIWLTDVAMHQVFKYSNTLQLLLTLGVRFVPGGDDKHFCSPTDVAVSRDGNFFVSDGYCNSRILQFNQMGDLIGKIYGQTPGLPAPHVFKVPHSLSLDADHNRLFVADRENGRVIVFNSDSKTFIDQYTGFGERVFAADYNKINDTLYVVNGDDGYHVVQGYTFSVRTKQIIETWKPEQGVFEPYDLVSPAGGTDVYVCQMNPNRVWKFQKQENLEK